MYDRDFGKSALANILCAGDPGASNGGDRLHFQPIFHRIEADPSRWHEANLQMRKRRGDRLQRARASGGAGWKELGQADSPLDRCAEIAWRHHARGERQTERLGRVDDFGVVSWREAESRARCGGGV